MHASDALVDVRGVLWRRSKNGTDHRRCVPVEQVKVTAEQAQTLFDQGRFLHKYEHDRLPLSAPGDEDKKRNNFFVFLRQPFTQSATADISQQLTGTLHLVFENLLKAEALRALIAIDAELYREFEGDVFMVLKGSSAARLVALDRLKQLSSRRRKHSSDAEVEALQADFTRWMTPSDWDANIVVNPRLMSKRRLKEAHDTLHKIHGIVEEEMRVMGNRLANPRDASDDELFELNALSGVPIQRDTARWDGLVRGEKQQVQKGKVKEVRTFQEVAAMAEKHINRLPGIEEMLGVVIKEAGLKGFCVGKRQSFEVSPLLDFDAPADSKFKVGERLKLCTTAAVTLLKPNSKPSVIYTTKNTTLILPEKQTSFDLLRLLACVRGPDGVKYKVELLDVSVGTCNLPRARIDFKAFSQKKNVYVYKGLRCTSLQYLFYEIKGLVKDAAEQRARGVPDKKEAKRIERAAMYSKLVCLLGLSDAYDSERDFKLGCKGFKKGNFNQRLKLVSALVEADDPRRGALLQMSARALSAFGQNPSSEVIDKVLSFDARLKSCDGRAGVSPQTVFTVVEFPDLDLSNDADERIADRFAVLADINSCTGAKKLKL